MAVSNPWLTPFQRSYDQIKTKLIDNMKLKVPEITDYSEGNILVIIISLFASIAEVLHYYIDNAARESFFSTARRYTSLSKHAKLVDYHIKSAIPSMVDVLISLTTNEPIDKDVEIPENTEFTANGLSFISTKKVKWTKGSYGVYVPLVQKVIANNGDDVTFSDSLPSADVMLTLGDIENSYKYVEGSMVLKMKLGENPEEAWALVDTFAYSGPLSKHYKVELDDNQTPYIVFGDGVFGLKPVVGSRVYGSYYITAGANGNIAIGNITTVPASISSLVTNMQCYNTSSSVGGSDYESFDMLKEHIPLSIKTLGVAISKEDYEDIAKLTPGVDKAFVNYICGKFIDIYITPDGGGIAPSGLLNECYMNVLKRKVITTHIQVLPTSMSTIYIDATITGKKSFKTNDISTQILGALRDCYNYNTSGINKTVRLSDLYSLMDNLPMVDYLKINNLFIKPSGKLLGTTTTPLNVSALNIGNLVDTLKVKITVLSVTNGVALLSIINNNTGEQITSPVTVGSNIVINDSNMAWSMKVLNPLTGAYVYGDCWLLQLNPNNVDQEVNGYTIPIFDPDDSSSIILEINETV